MYYLPMCKGLRTPLNDVPMVLWGYYNTTEWRVEVVIGVPGVELDCMTYQ